MNLSLMLIKILLYHQKHSRTSWKKEGIPRLRHRFEVLQIGATRSYDQRMIYFLCRSRVRSWSTGSWITWTWFKCTTTSRITLTCTCFWKPVLERYRMSRPVRAYLACLCTVSYDTFSLYTLARISQPSPTLEPQPPDPPLYSKNERSSRTC